jgi:hypothetical protein
MRVASACTAVGLLHICAASTPSTALYFVIPRDPARLPQGPFDLNQLKEWHAHGGLPSGKDSAMLAHNPHQFSATLCTALSTVASGKIYLLSLLLRCASKGQLWIYASTGSSAETSR